MNIRAKIFGTNDAADESPLLGSKKPRGAKADMLDSISVTREEFRRGNTRLDDRHRLSSEEGMVVWKGNSHPVSLINVSGGGAMIVATFQPKLWDRLELRLGEGGSLDCAVRWIKEDRIGLEFAHETRLDCSRDEQANLLREVIRRSFSDMEFEATGTQPEPKPTADSLESRGDRRHPLIWSGALHYDFQSIPVRLRNISSTGALVDCPIKLRVGAEPLLDLGDAGSIFATVAWAIGDQIGLKFQSQFDMGQLARSRPQVAPARSIMPDYLRTKAAEETGREWGRLSLSELRDELEGFMKH